jgi:hypothetical protein
MDLKGTRERISTSGSSGSPVTAQPLLGQSIFAPGGRDLEIHRRGGWGLMGWRQRRRVVVGCRRRRAERRRRELRFGCEWGCRTEWANGRELTALELGLVLG